MEFYYTDAANQARGPVTLAELQDLAAAGHLSANTMVAAVGSQQWVSIGLVLPAVGPAPIMSAPTEPLAIWSLVLSLLSFWCCLLTAIPGVICGHLALSNIKKKTFVQGRGLAIAGLIVGYLAIAVFVGYILVIAIVAMSEAGKHS